MGEWQQMELQGQDLWCFSRRYKLGERSKGLPWEVEWHS